MINDVASGMGFNLVSIMMDEWSAMHDVAKRLTGEILERTSPDSPMDESGVKRVTSLCCR